jgi:hypothetical protein
MLFVHDGINPIQIVFQFQEKFIRLRQTTLQFTAGMNGVANRAVAR